MGRRRRVLRASTGLAGIECLSGIPGSTGATPIQNVGAYGQDVSQTIAWVRVVRPRDATRCDTLDAAACRFGYRSSRFKYRDRWTVLAVAFRLTRVELLRPDPLRRAGAHAGRAGRLPGRPLAAVRDAVLGLRRGKGMVIDPGDPDSVSAGSFFTNPILDPEEWARDTRRPTGLAGAGRADQDLGGVADRARRLLPRLRRRPRRDLHQAHARARQPRRGDSTAELMALAREIADGVRAAFGVELHPEPVLVGHYLVTRTATSAPGAG